jgi:hypothetical protein
VDTNRTIRKCGIPWQGIGRPGPIRQTPGRHGTPAVMPPEFAANCRIMGLPSLAWGASPALDANRRMTSHLPPGPNIEDARNRLAFPPRVEFTRAVASPRGLAPPR